MHVFVMLWTDWIPINIDLICILYFLDNLKKESFKDIFKD